MIRSLLFKIYLFFRPIKKGDVFYGDPSWFVTSKPIEMVLHGLKDKYGITTHKPVPSLGCFRLTVINRSMPYYILDSEVFCTTDDDYIGTWKKRTQPKRMSKEMFREFYLIGLLERK